jgi:predicted TIM-barrel fold metal-dependent hydrolase
VLLDHCARPDLSDGTPFAASQALFDMAAFPGVYLKLTNRTLTAATAGKSTPQDFLARVIETFGAGRIAWGSNFPAAEGALPTLVATAHEALSSLSSDDQAMIFSGTAATIYPALSGGGKHG